MPRLVDATVPSARTKRVTSAGSFAERAGLVLRGRVQMAATCVGPSGAARSGARGVVACAEALAEATAGSGRALDDGALCPALCAALGAGAGSGVICSRRRQPGAARSSAASRVVLVIMGSLLPETWEERQRIPGPPAAA